MKTLLLLFLLAAFAAGETKVYLHTGTQATRLKGSPTD